MALTTVVNIHKAKYDMYIGRAGMGKSGYFGNPFRLKPGQQRGATLAAYRSYFYHRIENDPIFRAEVHKLKGKVLGCFCKPHACHGDIIAEYLNSLPDPQ